MHPVKNGEITPFEFPRPPLTEVVAGIVEAKDFFEDGDFGITASLPGLLPKQLCLDRFEYRLDCRVDGALQEE